MAFVPVAIQAIGAVKAAKSSQGQQGQQGQSGEQSLSSQALKSWDDATRRDQLVIRGPPPKEAVSMVRYIVIAVLIMVVLLIYYGIGRKPQEAPKYQSVFGFTPGRFGLPAMPAERSKVPNTDATRVFGIVPKKPITNRVI